MIVVLHYSHCFSIRRIKFKNYLSIALRYVVGLYSYFTNFCSKFILSIVLDEHLGRTSVDHE